MSACNDSDEDEKNDDELDTAVKPFKQSGYKLCENKVDGYEPYGEIDDFFEQIEANEREREAFTRRQTIGVSYFK